MEVITASMSRMGRLQESEYVGLRCLSLKIFVILYWELTEVERTDQVFD